MPVTLPQSQAITELALQLVDWLPGSSAWGSYTLATAAAETGVTEFWAGGSKKPALTQLLELTYERRSDRFCPLVLTIVRNGMSRRQQQGDGVQRREIEHLNAILERLSFKIPELWDRSFLDSLAAPEPEPPAEPEPERRARHPDPRPAMPAFHDRFMALYAASDRAKAGRDFEPLLDDLFTAWELAPSRSYRVTGEEIDNSFVLDGDTYLLEAKWIAEKTQVAALYTFRQKVAGKSAYTRGLFIAVEGFTTDAMAGLGTGLEHRIVLLDGVHLMRVLTGAVALPDLLRLAARHLEQYGQPLLPHKRLAELS
jgi:hypothetical protein